MQTKYWLVLAVIVLFVLPKPVITQGMKLFVPEELWRQMSAVVDDLDVYEAKKDRLEKTLNQSVQAAVSGFDFDEPKLRQDLTDFNGYRIKLKGQVESIIESLNLLTLTKKDKEIVLAWEIFVKGRFVNISRIVVPITTRRMPKNFV